MAHAVDAVDAMAASPFSFDAWNPFLVGFIGKLHGKHLFLLFFCVGGGRFPPCRDTNCCKGTFVHPLSSYGFVVVRAVGLHI